MNILQRLPDDLKDVIYYQLHQLNMKSLKNELEDELDKRWGKMSIDTQVRYMYNYYHTDNAIYSVFDDNNDGKYIRPEKVVYYGYCRILDEYNEDDDIYISKLLINPTYADILLECEKKISITGDFHHSFLEDVSILGDFFDKEIDEYIKIIDVFLGS